jgi:hypothetical protein
MTCQKDHGIGESETALCVAQDILQWTQGGDGARLMMLVYHDDAKREYAPLAVFRIRMSALSLTN